MTPIAKATYDAHTRLHRAGPFHRIAKNTFTSEDVTLALALHLRAWSHAIEMPHAADGSFLCASSLRDFFRLDRFQIALSDYATRPDLREVTLASSNTSFLAAAYVFLGAQKGGFILAKRLGAAGHTKAAACFSPEPDHDGLWRAVMAKIDACPQTQQERLHTDAIAWFDAFDIRKTAQSDGVCRAEMASMIAENPVNSQAGQTAF